MDPDENGKQGRTKMAKLIEVRSRVMNFTEEGEVGEKPISQKTILRTDSIQEVIDYFKKVDTLRIDSDDSGVRYSVFLNKSLRIIQGENGEEKFLMGHNDLKDDIPEEIITTLEKIAQAHA